MSTYVCMYVYIYIYIYIYIAEKAEKKTEWNAFRHVICWVILMKDQNCCWMISWPIFNMLSPWTGTYQFPHNVWFNHIIWIVSLVSVSAGHFPKYHTIFSWQETWKVNCMFVTWTVFIPWEKPWRPRLFPVSGMKTKNLKYHITLLKQVGETYFMTWNFLCGINLFSELQPLGKALRH